MQHVRLPIANTDREYEVAPTKIICLGLNYRDHIKESLSVEKQGRSTDDPTEPVLFNKTPNVLIGSGEGIHVPRIVFSYGFERPRTDYEGELAMIVDRECKDVTEEEAMSHILGFTCFNDISQRDVQNSDRSGWFRGKSFDTFGPIGPCLVLREDLADVADTRIETRRNGEVVQSGRTSQMIFGLPEIVSFVSRNFSLEAGDIIVTGTPSGVGPLSDGDTVEVEIDGIGVLENRVVFD